MQLIFKIGFYFAPPEILNGAGLNEDQDQQNNTEHDQYGGKGNTEDAPDDLFHFLADGHGAWLRFLVKAKSRPFFGLLPVASIKGN
jgi:hypothetical protein